jgi:hypothetical protein
MRRGPEIARPTPKQREDGVGGGAVFTLKGLKSGAAAADELHRPPLGLTAIIPAARNERPAQVGRFSFQAAYRTTRRPT